MQSLRKRGIGLDRLLVFFERAFVLVIGKKVQSGVIVILGLLAGIVRHGQTGF